MFSALTDSIAGSWVIFEGCFPLFRPLEFGFVVLQPAGVMPFGCMKPERFLNAFTLIKP